MFHCTHWYVAWERVGTCLNRVIALIHVIYAGISAPPSEQLRISEMNRDFVSAALYVNWQYSFIQILQDALEADQYLNFI